MLFSLPFGHVVLACLAGRQAALLARYVYAGAGHSGHTALQSILEGLFRAAYPALLEGAAYMWHLVGQPRKGISSGYWKWSSKGFEAKSNTSE